MMHINIFITFVVEISMPIFLLNNTCSPIQPQPQTHLTQMQPQIKPHPIRIKTCLPPPTENQQYQSSAILPNIRIRDSNIIQYHNT